MQTGDNRCIHPTDLDKACFQHNMAYGIYKDLVKITESNKRIRDMMEMKEDQLNGYKFFDKKSAPARANKSTGSGAMSSQQLADNLHKPITSKENSKDAKSFLLLKTIFVTLILLICN